MLLCKNRRLFAVAGDNSHVLTPIPMHLIPIPISFPSHGWSYSHSHGNPMGPMGSQSSPFPCTPLVAADWWAVTRKICFCWDFLGKQVAKGRYRLPRTNRTVMSICWIISCCRSTGMEQFAISRPSFKPCSHWTEMNSPVQFGGCEQSFIVVFEICRLISRSSLLYWSPAIHFRLCKVSLQRFRNSITTVRT